MRTALECVYEAIRERIEGVSFSQFAQAMRGWDLFPLERDGRPVGAVMTSGPVMHIAIIKEARGHWLRGLIRDRVRKMIAAHGYAATEVMDGHKIGHRLAALAGFEKVSSENGATKYICHRGAL